MTRLGTGPLRLWPEHGPAGVPSPLRSHHVMIRDTQVSGKPPFKHPKRQVATLLRRPQRQEACISGGLALGWSRGEAELRGCESLQTSPSGRHWQSPGRRHPCFPSSWSAVPTLGSQEYSQPWASESLPPSSSSLCSCQHEINHICSHLGVTWRRAHPQASVLPSSPLKTASNTHLASVWMAFPRSSDLFQLLGMISKIRCRQVRRSGLPGTWSQPDLPQTRASSPRWMGGWRPIPRLGKWAFQREGGPISHQQGHFKFQVSSTGS